MATGKRKSRHRIELEELLATGMLKDQSHVRELLGRWESGKGVAAAAASFFDRKSQLLPSIPTLYCHATSSCTHTHPTLEASTGDVLRRRLRPAAARSQRRALACQWACRRLQSGFEHGRLLTQGIFCCRPEAMACKLSGLWSQGDALGA